MKRFKYFSLVLVSVLCLFAAFTFGGCQSQGSYVADSFKYSIQSYSFAYYVSGDFKITVPKAGKYKVEYTLTTRGSAGTQSQNATTNITAIESGEQTVSIYRSFDTVSGKSNYSATLSDIKITRTDTDTKYTEYAIGFGSAAGAVLVGAVVVFVLDKVGVFKKRK